MLGSVSPWVQSEHRNHSVRPLKRGINAGLGYIVMAARPEDNQQLLARPDQSPWRAGFGEGGRLEPLCTSLVGAEKEGEEGPASLVLCPPVSQ